MSAPPPYPRVPQLIAGRGGRDDLVLDPAAVASLLRGPVVVEEKLDGANVMVWVDQSGVRCALRSGPEGRDRAGQLGPLRAWLARAGAVIQAGLVDGTVVYGEWLWLRHTVSYDRLPGPLIGLDVWRPASGFAIPDDRNTKLAGLGVRSPPMLFRGIVGSIDLLESLMGTSAWGDGPMEGIVVRTEDGSEPRVAKLVRADWAAVGDGEWARGRPRNMIAAGGASWR